MTYSDRNQTYASKETGVLGGGPAPPPMLPIVPPSFPENLVNRTVVKALLKANNQTAHFGTMLAESKRTVTSAAESVGNVAHALIMVKRGKLRDAAQLLGIPNHKWSKKPLNLSKVRIGKDMTKVQKTIANRWLEIQYGWKPLISDIYAVIDGIKNRQQADKPERFSVVSNQEQQDESVTSGQFRLNGIWQIITRISHKCRVHLDYALDDTTVRYLNRRGLLDPAGIAWELMPYSFIIDWFLPIGDWIEAVQASRGLSFIGGTVTRTTTVDCVGSAWKAGNSEGNGHVNSLSATSSSMIKNVVRNIYLSSPIPMPYVKNPISTDHVLNALALLRSLKR